MITRPTSTRLDLKQHFGRLFVVERFLDEQHGVSVRDVTNTCTVHRQDAGSNLRVQEHQVR